VKEGRPEELRREAGELEFLVGNACSRVINLLMQPERDPVRLREELSFLGARATRLAQVLEQLADGE